MWRRASFDSGKQNEPLDPKQCLFAHAKPRFWDDREGFIDAESLLRAHGGRDSFQFFGAWDQPHGCLGVLTPDERASSCKAPEVQAIRAVEEVEPVFKIARENLCDDPRLPILRIRVEFRRRAA